MTISPELFSAYRFHRAEIAAGRIPPLTNSFQLIDTYLSLHRTASAFMALQHARRDLEAGIERHWYKPLNDRQNAFWSAKNGRPSSTDRMQWIENPSALGMRFVGYADEIDVGIGHTGWWTDDDGHMGTLRGVVYQLPSRGNVLRYLAGYEGSENKGTAAIDFRRVYTGEGYRDAWNHDPKELDAAREAARQGNSIAECVAEEEREHHRAYDAGAYWARLGEEIAATRDKLKAMLVERRAAKASGMPVPPTICEAIRDYIADELDGVADKRAQRKSLASGDYDGEAGYLGFWTGDANLVAAFNEGAELAVLA